MRWYTTNAYWIAFVIFAAISAPLILAFSAKQYQSVYESYAARQAYAEAEKKSYDECFSLRVEEEVRRCLSYAIESAREPQRSEEDVGAQKEMALWAFWTLIATASLGLLTLAATIVGAVFLWRSIQDTRDHFFADQRPWLTLDRPLIGVDDAAETLTFEIKAKNIGKTPAVGVEVHIKATRAKIAMPNVGAVEDFTSRFTAASYWKNNRRIIFHGKHRNLTPMDGHEVGGSRDGFIRVMYCVTYRSGALNRIYRTAGEAIFHVSSVSNATFGDHFIVGRYTHYGVCITD